MRIVINPLSLVRVLSCCCSITNSCPTLRRQALRHAGLPCPSPSLRLLKLTSVESVMPSNHLVLCRPLLLCESAFSSLKDI